MDKGEVIDYGFKLEMQTKGILRRLVDKRTGHIIAEWEVKDESST